MKKMITLGLIQTDGENIYCYNTNRELHNEYGPALIRKDGNKAWHINGPRHREDGPAIEYANGDKFWYLSGEQLTEGKFLEKNKNTNIEKEFDKIQELVNL
jgi:hypothetical protein